MKTTAYKLLVIKLILFGALLFAVSRTAFSQVDSTILNRVSGLSLGMVAGLGPSHPGMIGLEATSPPFLKGRLSIRVRGGFSWLESYSSLGYDVNSHPSLGTSVVYQSLVSQRTRFYCEVGTFVFLPSQESSDRSKVMGYSGTTGLEFFSRGNADVMLSYFFGAGMDVWATQSSESENHGDFGDGFIFTNGLRIYF